jgi:hypothetical protein
VLSLDWFLACVLVLVKCGVEDVEEGKKEERFGEKE